MPISLSGSLNLSGSLTTTGTITATTLVVQTITSSISSITGSTNFGSLSSDTHKFTGSLLVSGSATFSSSVTAASTLYLGNDGTYGSTYRTLGLTGITNGTHRIFAGTADNLYIAAASGRDIVFWTDGSSGTKMSLTTLGVLDLPVGQIKFPATQNPSSDANTLDDYEEGTWTPTFGGATDPTGVTYDGRSGSYTKVGRLVTVHFIMGFTTYTGGSGALQVRGLPFTCSGETSNGACQLEQLAFAAGRTSASVRVSNGTTSVEPQQFGGTTSWTSYTIGTAFTSSGTGKYVQATVTYTTT